MAIHAELIPLEGLGDAELERWWELAGEASEPNPFFEPAFVLPAALGLESIDLSMLVARDEGGRWLGCMPVRPARRWRGVPLPVLASWVHLYCFLGTPLLAGGSERAALEAMLPVALAARRHAFLGLSLFGTGGPAEAALEQAAETLGLRVIAYERTERAGLRRRADPAGYIAVNRKHQREFERQRRRLSEELGCEPRVVDRAGEEDAVERFLELEASGWKGKAGTALGSTENHARMLRRICAAYARENRLLLLSFECGERSLAMGVNLRAGSSIYCFKIGFDEEFSRFSPGIQLLLGTAEEFHGETDAELIDSCAVPSNRMINNLWADRVPLAALAVTTRARSVLAGPAVRRLGAYRARRRNA